MTIKYRFKTWNEIQREQVDPLEALPHILVLKKARDNAYFAFKKNHQYIPGFTPDNIKEIDEAREYLLKNYHTIRWDDRGITHLEYINEEDNKND